MMLPTINILLVGISAIVPDIRVQYSTFDVYHVCSRGVSTDRITTVSLPVPIRGLEGLFISSDAAAPSKFQISFRPGEQFFSIRALQTNATGNLNIVTPEGVLCLEIQAVENPVLAVNFFRPSAPTPTLLTQTTKPVAESPIAPVSRKVDEHVVKSPPPPTISVATTSSKKVAPTEKILSKLIERARAEGPILRRDGRTQVPIPNSWRTGFKDSKDISIRGIFEFEEFDALVFRIELLNSTKESREYQLDKLAVESGSTKLHVSRIEGEGIVGPSDAGTVYFAVSGGVDEATSNLCSSWSFKVTVPYMGASSSTSAE